MTSLNDFLGAGIKKKILKSLTESVTELQYQYKGKFDSIPSNEVTNRLSTALEAVFSHGLKVGLKTIEILKYFTLNIENILFMATVS